VKWVKSKGKSSVSGEAHFNLGSGVMKKISFGKQQDMQVNVKL